MQPAWFNIKLGVNKESKLIIAIRPSSYNYIRKYATPVITFLSIEVLQINGELIDYYLIAISEWQPLRKNYRDKFQDISGQLLHCHGCLRTWDTTE